MESFQERRSHARVSPDSYKIGIIQSRGLACCIDGYAQDLLFMYVDVKNCSDGGASLEVPFKLPSGTIVNIALPDNNTGQWKICPAMVCWTRKADMSKTFHVGLKYLTEGPQLKEQLVWETDPKKPSPDELYFFVQSGFFEAISHAGLSLLLNSFQKIKPGPGERFISQGQPGDCLYLIQNGTCKVFVEKEGIVRTIAMLKAGDIVGEMSVLTGEPRSANVEAQTEMTLWKLDARAFEALADSYPDLRLFLTEIMSKRFETSIFVRDRTIGKYLLSNRIGKGGWGIVYRGIHNLLKMPVAIKMMKHDMAMEPLFLETFRREAEIIARMRHPNIVSVYDIEEVYRTIFIVMECLEGVSLKEMMEKAGPIPAERCVNILAQVCAGLICAHSYDIIHRDIKPGNIFLLENDLVKLLDFGLACVSGTKDMNIAGTVYYASPEQIDGRPVDFRSDLYSLGIMAYEMVTGQRPFQEENLAQLMDLYCKYDIPDPAEIMPEIDQNMREFIRTCTRCDPDKRYQSTQQARKELMKFYSHRDMPGEASEKKERVVTSLLLFHTPEQQQDLKAALEEFGSKVSHLGIKISMSEHSDTY